MDKASEVSSQNYGLVYKVDENNIDSLKDVGDDPCFESPPTWGICRQNIRNRTNLTKGSYLLFIANVGNDYYLRGCFRVAKKVDIIQAWNDFPNRQNVIISSSKSGIVNKKWDYRKRKKLWETKNGKTIPDFFQTFNYHGQDYYQRFKDDHGIDNWKCSRIYNCRKVTFEKCMASNICIKEREKMPLKKNYIIGDGFNTYDWPHLKLKWDYLVKALDFPQINRIKIKENVFKHPEIKLSSEKITSLFEYMAKKAD